MGNLVGRLVGNSVGKLVGNLVGKKPVGNERVGKRAPQVQLRLSFRRLKSAESISVDAPRDLSSKVVSVVVCQIVD